MIRFSSNEDNYNLSNRTIYVICLNDSKYEFQSILDFEDSNTKCDRCIPRTRTEAGFQNDDCLCMMLANQIRLSPDLESEF